MEATIDPFQSLLLSIANDLTMENFNNMKFLCHGIIPKGRLEGASTAIDLFKELCHLDYLNSSKRACLADLLYHIGRHDLRNRLLGERETLLTPAFQHWGGLPYKVPNFVGRDQEVDDVISKLTGGSKQIVTITGPPGFGKSCVAIRVGHKLLLHRGISVYYISLRDSTSLSCMAYRLLGALGIVASNDPIEQARHCIIQLTQDTVIVLDNAEDMLVPEAQNDFCKYVEVIAQQAIHVRLLLTSRKSMTFLNADSFSLPLDALQPEPAQQLLHLSVDNPLTPSDAEELAGLCCHVPLVLRTMAALLKSIDPETLILEFQKSPSEMFNFTPTSLPDYHKMFHCLDICFSRLCPELQVDLISTSLYPTTFLVQDGGFLLERHNSKLTLQFHLQKLVDNSLLQFDPVSKQYAMHGVIKAFCIEKSKNNEQLKLSYQNAKKVFNRDNLDLLRELDAQFRSQDACTAFKMFLVNRRDISQAMQDAVLDLELENECIDFANEVAPFLSKAFRKEKFLAVYGAYKKVCEKRGDDKRYSDCLTSEAYCILSHFDCHMPCEEAFEKFKKANEIQEGLNDESTIRAHCLSKLGRCYAQFQQLDKGVAMIKRAIAIREKLSDEIFLGVSYKDLAAAYSFNEEHTEANRLRQESVLPIYRRLLGNHPYMATLMDDMGRSYGAMGDYVNAHTYIQEALRMRIKGLGDHQETARSYHDLGTVLGSRERYDEALEAYREALRIQHTVMGAHGETVRTHHEIARVLRLQGKDDEAADEDKKATEAEREADNGSWRSFISEVALLGP